MAACTLGGIAAAECKACHHDAITNALLDARYVEFITPDGKTRLCYNANTLGRIRRHGHLAQPPHFRFRMCAADERKIFYMFPHLEQQTSAAARGISPQQMNRYLMRVETAYKKMKAKNLYACPVAWTQLTCGNKESYADDDIWAQRIARDPMLVCHNYIIQREAQGHDGFTELAAVFHTRKRDASTHLKSGYSLETSKRFSQLLERYSMREGDGIVQNYLTSIGGANHGGLLAYWAQNYYRKSLYMSLWSYNTSVDAQTGTRLPEYAPTAAGEIMDRLESIVAPTSDSDSSFIAGSSEDEEHNSFELDERASAAAVDRSREQTQNELFAAAAAGAAELRTRNKEKRKRRAERQAAIRARVQIALDDDFYDRDDVLESVEKAEREKAKEESRRKRRKPSGAAAVMFDSDEEDFTSSFNVALRF